MTMNFDLGVKFCANEKIAVLTGRKIIFKNCIFTFQQSSGASVIFSHLRHSHPDNEHSPLHCIQDGVYPCSGHCGI